MTTESMAFADTGTRHLHTPRLSVETEILDEHGCLTLEAEPVRVAAPGPLALDLDGRILDVEAADQLLASTGYRRTGEWAPALAGEWCAPVEPDVCDDCGAKPGQPCTWSCSSNLH